MVALQRAGIQVEQYYAYEIEPNAIKISQKNYPQIMQCGDVTAEDFTKYKGVDLLIGGSPCQGFSFAGKQMNFEDPRSRLYFEFERAVREAKPKYFLLENVKMKKEYSDVITQRLGVQPIEINSSLVSAQKRSRIYWTNIPGVCLPNDKRIMLEDIVHETRRDDVDLSRYMVPFDKSLLILEKEVYKGKIGYFRQDSQANRVYSIHGKAVTLCGEAGGGAAKMGQYLFGCITPVRINKMQNGQRFNTGEKFYTLTAQDKHGILVDGYIRKLTPVECERLQTLPDGYTEGVSEPNRYKCLGNGWTVDVIAHILSHLPEDAKGE
jgi:DNA (cytosine-5)-methyltransferase 3A